MENNKNDFEEIIRKRTATRKFKSDKVSSIDLEKILESGRLAPTAKNLQPQKIFVVQSEDGLEKIDKVSPCRYGAPVVLIVCSDKNIAWSKNDNSSYEIDASIVATHMMLEATNLGIDSVWVGMFDNKKLKKEFNLDNNIEPICLLPLGYASDDYAGNPMHNQRKELKEIVKYL